MKAPTKILTMLFAATLAFGLTACSSNGEDKAADANTSNTEVSADNNGADEAAVEENYVECNGERMGLNEWCQMFSTNPLAMDNYIGKEIAVVSDFQSISNSTFYYTSGDEKNVMASGLATKYEAPVGLLNLDGVVTAEIPETDRSMASGLKPGDKVKVTGTISGWFASTTIMLLPSSGAEYAGPITIEKL